MKEMGWVCFNVSKMGDYGKGGSENLASSFSIASQLFFL
jgi:hypothetical protein